MLLRLEETCSEEKANHTARLPRSTPISGILPISSGLTHRTPLQRSTGQKLLTWSFAIWLGVFQRSWTLYFTLVTAHTGQYSTNFDSDWIYQCNKIYTLNCSDEYFHKRSDRLCTGSWAGHNTDSFKGLYCPPYSFNINYHVRNFRFQSR